MLRIGCVTCAKASQEHEECHVFLQPNGEAMEVQQSHCHAYLISTIGMTSWQASKLHKLVVLIDASCFPGS